MWVIQPYLRYTDKFNYELVQNAFFSLVNAMGL